MAHEYNISESGLELIKAYEGFRPVVTVLVSGQKVIGYSHPYMRGEAALLTQKKAEELLKSALEPIENIINHIVFAPLSQNQFDALVSLAFNIGIDDFADSTVLHYLNNGQPLAAAAGFDEWRKSVIADQTYVIDALVRRRTAEKALFLSLASGIVSAPRYEVPVLHDNMLEVGVDDIEVFSKSDEDGFVDQIPYEDQPAHDRRSEDGSGGTLMLSERVAAPQIYEDTLDANLVNEADSIEDVVINNVIEMKPETEFETDVGPKQNEGLSPIALAAADVSERLDNLMEKTKTAAQDEPKVIQPASDAEADAPSALEAEILKSEALETKPLETEISEVEAITEQEKADPVVVEKENGKGAGAFWSTLIVGLLLIGGSLWKMKFAPTTNMGEMGEFLAPVALLVGALMIMGGMFYMIKARLR